MHVLQEAAIHSFLRLEGFLLGDSASQCPWKGKGGMSSGFATTWVLITSGFQAHVLTACPHKPCHTGGVAPPPQSRARRHGGQKPTGLRAEVCRERQSPAACGGSPAGGGWGWGAEGWQVRESLHAAKSQQGPSGPEDAAASDGGASGQRVSPPALPPLGGTILCLPLEDTGIAGLSLAPPRLGLVGADGPSLTLQSFVRGWCRASAVLREEDLCSGAA